MVPIASGWSLEPDLLSDYPAIRRAVFAGRAVVTEKIGGENDWMNMEEGENWDYVEICAQIYPKSPHFAEPKSVYGHQPSKIEWRSDTSNLDLCEEMTTHLQKSLRAPLNNNLNDDRSNRWLHSGYWGQGRRWVW